SYTVRRITGIDTGVGTEAEAGGFLMPVRCARRLPVRRQSLGAGGSFRCPCPMPNWLLEAVRFCVRCPLLGLGEHLPEVLGACLALAFDAPHGGAVRVAHSAFCGPCPRCRQSLVVGPVGAGVLLFDREP